MLIDLLENPWRFTGVVRGIGGGADSCRVRPAALRGAVVTGTAATMMRTGYVEEHHKLSVGAIAMLAMIEHQIDGDRVEIIDFGTGDDSYKATWV